MARLASQNKCEAAYKKRNYDVKTVQMPKGALEQLAQIAAAAGVSVNRYILEAVEARSGLKLTLDGELPTLKKKREPQETQD